MGQLINGQWVVQSVNPKTPDGEFVRKDMVFRNKINETSDFKPETGRYHLYVAYACPWANRALIMRNLKGLKEHISFSVVSPYMFEDGWTFKKDFDGVTGDLLQPERQFLREVYTSADPQFTGRVTVPILWDCQNKTIVNNESSEILRIFNSSFDKLTGNDLDFYPSALRTDIDAINERTYHDINNGVYKTGFARTQSAYEKNFKNLFQTLDDMEAILSKQQYLVGDQFTEADIRLFVTLVRFDCVYFSHFKCNLRRIADYPHLQSYVEKIYSMPEVKETIHFDHIKTHYYASHESINPTRIVPLGPNMGWCVK